MKKFLSLALAAAMMVSSFAGCSSSNKSSSTDEKVFFIGGSGPLTGDYATYGTSVKNGAELAAKEINENGGVNGYTVKVQVEDDQADPEQAVKAYATLMDRGINASLGCVTSGACVAVTEEAKRDGIITMTPSASQLEAAQYDNNFRVCFLDPDQGTYSADFIADNKIGTKVAILYDKSTDYSVGVYKAFVRQAEKRGLEVVETQTFDTSNNTDFSTQLQKVKESGADIFFCPFYQSEAAKVLKQMNDMEMTDMIVFGVDGMDGVLAQLGEENAALANGVFLLTPFAADSTDPVVVNFVTKYKAAYNETPDQFAADAYDAVYALCNAFEIAGKDTTDADFNEAMISAMVEVEMDGATGHMTWTADGECQKTATANVIVDGAYVAYSVYSAQ